jgi:WD40 repeat protein
MYDQQRQPSPWPPQSQFKQTFNSQPLWDQQTQPDILSLHSSHLLEFQHEQPNFPSHELGSSPVILPSSPITITNRPKQPLRRLTTRKFICYSGGLSILFLVLIAGLIRANIVSHQNNVSTNSVFPPIGTNIQSFNSPNGAISSGFLAWSQDGTQLFSVRQNGTVQELNTATWDNTLTYKIPGNFIFAASWSPDRMYFATTSSFFDPQLQQGMVRVWNTLTGEEVQAYQGHSDLVSAIAWSPDGTRIATGSQDKTVQIWDVTTGNTILTYHANSAIWAVAWSPDGTRIALASDAAIQIFDVTTGNILLTYQGHPDGAWKLAWSPDGKYIASAGSKDSTIQI